MNQRIGKWYRSAKGYARAHKIVSVIVLIGLAFVAWRIYAAATNTSGQTHYVLGQAATSTIVASVSESGQVSTTESINLTPQVSGKITWIGVSAGDTLRAGQALMTIDNTSALQSVADAKRQLAADELSYQQSTAQAPINYQNDVTALATTKENLQEDYNNVYNDLTSTYLDLPNIMSNANDIIYGYDLDTKKTQWNMDVLVALFGPQVDTSTILTFQTQARTDYTTATNDYNAGLATYQTTSRSAQTSALDALLEASTAVMTDATQVLQTELNFLNAVSNLAQTYNVTLPSKFSTLQTNTRTYLSTANSDLSILLADKKTLDTAKQAIVSAEQTITLDQVGNPDGSNPISLQVAANNIAKEKEDLATLETNLADYTIVAPFDGTVSGVSAQVGQNANGTLATIVTTTQIAELSLNEVDAAKIKLGEKATLTFDAIDGLTLTGTVSEIDPVGTVSQGVVSYDVKVSFDAQNNQVKPGMTVNAAIQTGVAQDALVVPSSAVKTTVGGGSYVLAFEPPLDVSGAASSQGITTTEVPQQIPVVTGLSDNTNVEILSGLSAGQQIILRTTTGAASTASSASATSASRTTTGSVGGGALRTGGGGGGAVIRGL